MELSKRYKNLKSKVTDRCEQVASLMKFIENETSHMTEHSVNVAETMKIKAVLFLESSDESCVIVELLYSLGQR